MRAYRLFFLFFKELSTEITNKISLASVGRPFLYSRHRINLTYTISQVDESSLG